VTETEIYVAVSVLYFLEFAVWGAWYPLLAARLLGPLQMTGKQTGWIYSTLPIAFIVSPLVAGQVADKWLNAEWILAGCHLVGAVLLFAALWQRTFRGMFVVMLLYSLCYAATLPLANAVVFAQVKDPKILPWVLLSSPVAWALIGYVLTAWHYLAKREGGGGDFFVFAGLLSVLLTVCCFFLPATKPAGQAGTPIVDALAQLQQSNFLIFILASLVIAGLMQFYFMGSARFMTDMGISAKAVPATMAIAQAAQSIATIVAVGTALETFGIKSVLDYLGYKLTLTVGALSWLLLYVIYVLGKPRSFIICGQALHGFAYVLFMVVAWKYVDEISPKGIESSMQSLYFVATTGIGLFLGSLLAGMVMDQFSEQGKFQWRKIWAVPLVIMLTATIVLAALFQGKVP
jgi:nucleoside transporter